MRYDGQEFEEIANCGGTITFTIRTREDGIRSYQVGFSGSRPVPMVMIGIYALPQGIPVDTIQMGGIGQPWNQPPVPNCIPVIIGSDSTGHFGHNCPKCEGYWRSGAWASVCPYCGFRAARHEFLSQAQCRYVTHYCDVLAGALAGEDGEVNIDMDAVADAVGKEGDKPSFYVSEQSQQRKFKCKACGEFNDILGRFGYCASCGTRNDLADFEGETVPTIRNQLNNGTTPEDCLRSAISAFDSVVAQIAKELVRFVPMTKRRSGRLEVQRFHNPEELRNTMRDWFDISMADGIKDVEWASIVRMFHRRHVYEHNGGEVDQKYLDDSGDTSVKLKQHIRETQEGVHDLLSSLVKMVRNLHNGFHELLPPLQGPIAAFEENKARLAKYSKDR
ncbi:MAG: hypothetical protein ACOY82_02185 [Pseudomonadota bacterium]